MPNNLLNNEEVTLINKLYDELLTDGNAFGKEDRKAELMMLLKGKVQIVESVVAVLSRADRPKDVPAALNERIVNMDTVNVRQPLINNEVFEQKISGPDVYSVNSSEMDARVVSTVDVLKIVENEEIKTEDQAIRIEESNNADLLKREVSVPDADLGFSENSGSKEAERPIVNALGNYCELDPADPTGKVILVNRLPFAIGREEGSVDFMMDERGISRRHAQISQDVKKRYFIEDLNAKNGTFVNGRRIKAGKTKQVKNGDTITLYNYDFNFKIND